MKQQRNIFPKTVPALGNLPGWAGLWAFVLLLIGSSNATAQEINVSGAVISIPSGVVLSVEGGITLQEDGGIANEGTLEVGGDWTNNGKGLLSKGKGKVIFKGEDQKIGGAQASEFNDLELLGKGSKELFADVSVSGRLTLRNCALITHQNGLALLGNDPFKMDASNAIVLAERIQTLDLSELRFEQAASPVSLQAFGFASSFAVVPSFRSSKDKSRGRQWPTSARLKMGGACAPQRVATASTGTTRERDAQIVHCAIQTMYFTRSQDADGNHSTCTLLENASYVNGSHDWDARLSTFNAPTRMLNQCSALASSFFAKEFIGIYKA